MNKSQANMEKMAAMTMITYTVGVLVGEAIRDEMYLVNEKDNQERPSQKRGKLWKLYSGLFILLKRKINLSARVLRKLVRQVLDSFGRLVWGDVRTLV